MWEERGEGREGGGKKGRAMEGLQQTMAVTILQTFHASKKKCQLSLTWQPLVNHYAVDCSASQIFDHTRIITQFCFIYTSEDGRGFTL